MDDSDSVAGHWKKVDYSGDEEIVAGVADWTE